MKDGSAATMPPNLGRKTKEAAAVPAPVTFAELSDSILALGLPPGSFVLRQSNGSVSVSYDTSQTTAQQRTDADALVAAWTAPTATAEARAVAKAALAGDPDALYKALRALALAAGDGDNVLRDWVTQFKAAVAAATSLANLQTRVAALPNLAQLTPANVKNAVANRVDTDDAN